MQKVFPSVLPHRQKMYNEQTLSSVGHITLYLLRDACNLLTAEVVMDIKVFIQ